MRINKFVAASTGMSRRAADAAIAEGRVTVNGAAGQAGQDITDQDKVTVDGKALAPPAPLQTVLLHKPVDYVVSRNGQGSRTIYDLLPPDLHHLNPIGRLDKDSSGLLLLTNDGQLAQELTHPSFHKQKVYVVMLDKPLAAKDKARIAAGVPLEDGPSRLQLKPLGQDGCHWQVTMAEGRNRQIRRTFAACGYEVTKLHRTSFGSYKLDDTKPGEFRLAN